MQLLVSKGLNRWKYILEVKVLQCSSITKVNVKHFSEKASLSEAPFQYILKLEFSKNLRSYLKTKKLFKKVQTRIVDH